jgi:hypothetical protein
MLASKHTSLYNNATFCNDKPCRLVETYHFIGGTYWRKLQVSRHYVIHSIDMGSSFIFSKTLKEFLSDSRMSRRIGAV